MKYGAAEVDKHDLSSLKCIITGGEPATPDAWNWTFEVVGKKRIPILNMSGGTEIGCSILTGSMIHPLKSCAFNGPALGSGAAVLDEAGNPVKPGDGMAAHRAIGALFRGNPAQECDYWQYVEGSAQYSDGAAATEALASSRNVPIHTCASSGVFCFSQSTVAFPSLSASAFFSASVRRKLSPSDYGFGCSWA